MRPATKGAILSGLCYPGTGQMFFGRIYLGLGIIAVTTIALVVLIYRIVMRLYRSMDALLDLLATKSTTFQKFTLSLSQTGYADWDLEKISLVVFLFCWLASAMHAYFLGKLGEQSENQS